jgi:hypothetical protein
MRLAILPPELRSQTFVESGKRSQQQQQRLRPANIAGLTERIVVAVADDGDSPLAKVAALITRMYEHEVENAVLNPVLEKKN